MTRSTISQCSMAERGRKLGGYLRLEYLLSREMSLWAPAGVAVSPMVISLLVDSFPVMRTLTSRSGRSVAPWREMQAEAPRARDQVRISAPGIGGVGFGGGGAADRTSGGGGVATDSWKTEGARHPFRS